MGRVLSFGRVDLHQIGRDPLLRIVPLAPLLLVLIVRAGVPPLAGWLARSHSLDVTPLAPLAVAFLLLQLIPYLFGTLIGLLLLEERDAGTLTALRVTPVPLRGYGAYRAGAATAATVVALLVCLPSSGLLAVPLVRALPAVGLAALAAPMWGLGLAAFAANKVEGFAAMKIASFTLLAPIAAWFTAPPWELAFGLSPTYWPAKALWQAQAGAAVWPYVLAGAAYHLALLAWLAHHLHTRLTR
jgi:fluoroquinolone transport system permease protein